MAQFFKGKVKTGASGGGLKKGGLKGLKAKKEAKQAAKEDSAKAAAPAPEAVTKKEEPAKSESPAPEKKVSYSMSNYLKVFFLYAIGHCPCFLDYIMIRSCVRVTIVDTKRCGVIAN